jgi:hypothetical protein
VSHVDDVHLLPGADVYEVLDELDQDDVVKLFPIFRRTNCRTLGVIKAISSGSDWDPGIRRSITSWVTSRNGTNVRMLRRDGRVL